MQAISTHRREVSLLSLPPEALQATCRLLLGPARLQATLGRGCKHCSACIVDCIFFMKEAEADQGSETAGIDARMSSMRSTGGRARSSVVQGGLECALGCTSSSGVPPFTFVFLSPFCCRYRKHMQIYSS